MLGGGGDLRLGLAILQLLFLELVFMYSFYLF